MAADGVGLYGRTDDKVVTFFSFGVMIFFTVLVIVLSLIQGRLESRKERMREELERLRRPVGPPTPQRADHLLPPGALASSRRAPSALARVGLDLGGAARPPAAGR